jgi:hypothetical protein
MKIRCYNQSKVVAIDGVSHYLSMFSNIYFAMGE